MKFFAVLFNEKISLFHHWFFISLIIVYLLTLLNDKKEETLKKIHFH